MKLFRMTVQGDVYKRFKKKTYYVVGKTKEEAENYLLTHLRTGYEIVSVAYLGEDMTMGRMMFSKE